MALTEYAEHCLNRINILPTQFSRTFVEASLAEVYVLKPYQRALTKLNLVVTQFLTIFGNAVVLKVQY